MRRFLFLLPLAAFASATGEVRNYWSAAEPETGEFRIEWREGATGCVSVVTHEGRRALRIEKANDVGYLVLKPRVPFAVPDGTKLRVTAEVASDASDPEYSSGFLRLHGDRREDLTYFGKFTYAAVPPAMNFIAQTVPGRPYRKISCYEATSETGTNVFPVIVVGNVRSVSYWTKWTVEDLDDTNRIWWDAVRAAREATPDRASEMQPLDFFRRGLAADVDHTAKVVVRDGAARFVMDGRERAPIFFVGNSGAKKSTYDGAALQAAGLDLQCCSVRLGDSPDRKGFWTREGFDVTGAVVAVEEAMRTAPDSKFLLGVWVDAYPEYADEHPDETWINDKGQKVFGGSCHSPYAPLPKDRPKHLWHWVSNHSSVWRADVKRNLGLLIGELKRTGLSKRIIGVHIAGYHDAQFAPVHPDYSPAAFRAFRIWLRGEYADVAALRRAWRDEAVSFETATPPVRRDQFSQHNFFDPEKDRPIVDYQRFLKIGPFLMQEDLARHVKRCFAKDIVVVRYCMSAFGGTYFSAYDITPFANSDAVDIIVAQPSYNRRGAGMTFGERLPAASFRRHGKFLVNEFDFRTYGAYTHWETELAAINHGRAPDYAAWESTNMKMAGQMLASRMGFWYCDMAGGWFRPPEIAADIGATARVGNALAAKSSAWHPDTAFVVDEQGLLLRNLIAPSHYHNCDEQIVVDGQLTALAGSGVPFDIWLIDDFLKDPSLAAGYRTLVFAGLYSIDAPRQEFLRTLKAGGRSLVFLAATGVAGGCREGTGFELTEKPFPAAHKVVAEPGVSDKMVSLMDLGATASILGVKSGWPVQFRSVTRHAVKEEPDQRVLARYAEDGAPAVAVRQEKGWRSFFICDAGGLTPDFFRCIVAESGGFAPAPVGVQVNMSGNFISLHAARNARFDFPLPFDCAVTDLRSGRPVPTNGRELPLDLKVGDSRWLGLKEVRCDD